MDEPLGSGNETGTGRDRLQPVEILENKTFTPKTIGTKTSILDLCAVTNRGKKINIEV
ncbi:hypothetical protein ACYULU_02385 [Breznakiellaceae bacterium SP9]